ncbi:MAG TPA: gluconate 2-dehydrogenase subunit 3 family protein [Sphingobacteriaceae bacterium]|nr:gluconate 2-dehydrogenase subunit 3 family protein [Sphingobacteriaceae bacterium]
MERREAMRNVALLLGGTLSASTFSVLFESCNASEKKGNKELFTSDQESLITEISDTIIPDTSTPGAKAAGVGPFIAMMIKECYIEETQDIFTKGLEEVQQLSKSKFDNDFVSLSGEERNKVLREIADNTIKFKAEDKKKEEAEKDKNTTVAKNKGTEKKNNKTYFFQLIRELTLLGYFTSEIGATKALAYLPVPGKFVGCVDLKPGQKTWAL